MATPNSLPAVDRCLRLYLTAFVVFGDNPFSPAELVNSSAYRNATNADVDQLLDLLVAYGLVAATDDGQYRIRCRPDEDVAQWRKRAAARGERLHELVEEERETHRFVTDESDQEPLRYSDELYASLFIIERDTVETIVETVPDAFDSSRNVVGIVLRSPADTAGHVQRIADELCDKARGADRRYTFEKEYSDVVGDHKNDLEFRLFLRAD